MKRIYVGKAPTPRYQSTWDVSKVTSYYFVITRSITRSEPQGIDIKNCYAMLFSLCSEGTNSVSVRLK